MHLFLPLADQLADASGDILRKHYRTLFAAESKPDKSLVTAIDRKVEETLRAIIHKIHPDHGFIGEETGSTNENAEYVWVIDPIDGTSSFVAGRPLFTTLIALLHHGKPILGIIDQPILRERWIGDGKTASLNGQPIRTRKAASLSDCILATTSPDLFSVEGKKFFDSIYAQTKQTLYGGDAYNYALLASGYVDIVIEEGLKPHDYLALIPIIEGAGGTVIRPGQHHLKDLFIAAGDSYFTVT